MQKIIKTLMQAYMISGDLNASIGKRKINHHRKLIESKRDSEELSTDWYTIGNDINQSIKAYNKRELMYNGK
ncbi:hypothetical protein [Staphylococcus sp. LKG3-1]|uniref:hypothetical protein n=1 Tax=unclassified Staphylococcus TaxID=91994 RepID=UPI003AFF7428